MVINCTPIFAHAHQDYQVECYTASWFGLIVVALGGITLYIIGIPGIFIYIIYRMRNTHVETTLRAAKTDLATRFKLLNEARAEYRLDGVFWNKPRNRREEFARMRFYLQKKNMNTLENRARIGFLCTYERVYCT